MIRYASVISLPNIRLYFPREKFSKEYLLIAGGRPPAVSWLQDAAADRVVYCIDHGADVCRAANLTPSFFIGDCDSVSADTLQWIRSLNVDFIQFPTEKDKTDTQLALDRFKNEQDIFVIMTGGFGGRFDHLSAFCIRLQERRFMAVSRMSWNSCLFFATRKQPSWNCKPLQRLFRSFLSPRNAPVFT